MIVGVSLFVAHGKPRANPAELRWLGIGTRGRWAYPQKIISDLPEIGNIASDRERLYFGIAQYDVHSIWHDTLDFGPIVRLEAELKHGVAPAEPAELRLCTV